MNNDFRDDLKNMSNEEISQFKEVDIKEYIIDMIESDDITVDEVAKFARINAIQGEIGQEIITTMEDGLEETKNVVTADEISGQPGWIVTNPSGEQYVVADSVFQKKYEIDPENPKQYKPKGAPVLAVRIKEDVEFVAPWGEKMKIEKGGSIIVSGPNDIYGIQEDEFNETYASTEKEPTELLDNLKDTIEFDKAIEERKQKQQDENVIE